MLLTCHSRKVEFPVWAMLEQTPSAVRLHGKSGNIVYFSVSVLFNLHWCADVHSAHDAGGVEVPYVLTETVKYNEPGFILNM